MNDDVIAARHGLRADDADPHRLAAVIALAVDYRGDVTLDLRDGGTVEGYLYDATIDADDPRAGTLRLMPADGGAKVAVPGATIRGIELTGRDTAAGKSFETWIRKYVERKRAGLAASIDCEDLDAHPADE